MEQELADTNESLSDLTCQNQAICGAKIKCEQVRMVTGYCDMKYVNCNVGDVLPEHQPRGDDGRGQDV